MEKSKKQLSVFLPAELVRDTKRAAIDRDMTITALVEAALNRYLTDDKGGEHHG